MHEYRIQEAIMPFSIRNGVEIPNRNPEENGSYNMDLIVFDQWEGMEDYILYEAFKFKEENGQSTGINTIQETLDDIVGRESETRKRFDEIARERKIGFVRGHGGTEQGRWFFSDHPVKTKVLIEVDRFIQLLPTENYGALVLDVCNPGRHSIKYSPVPVFYVKGLIGGYVRSTDFESASYFPHP